jgi:hypothetical protein
MLTIIFGSLEGSGRPPRLKPLDSIAECFRGFEGAFPRTKVRDWHPSMTVL